MSENLDRVVSIDELYGIYRENNTNELIIDVRTAEEFGQMNIEGSVNLPAIKIKNSSLDLSSKNRIYLVCKDGKTAAQAAKEFTEIYKNFVVYHVVTGGFEEWIQKKYPIISTLASLSAHSVDMDQNESDEKHIEKTTRLLPLQIRDKIASWLPVHLKVFFFKDSDRNCYLVCDLNEKRGFVVNPLIEIHHHIIDQLVRMDCDCDFTFYFENLHFEESPEPKMHAKDFATLTFSESISAKNLPESAHQLWNLKYKKQEAEDVLIFDKIAFTTKNNQVLICGVNEI